MTFQKTPVVRAAPEKQMEMMKIVASTLSGATDFVVEHTYMGRASVVVMAIKYFSSQAAELDPKTTSELLRALADANDPDASEEQTEEATARFITAQLKLYDMVDLASADTEGQA